MSDPIGYEADRCHFNFPGCKKILAGYLRREKYAQTGPWFEACESCALKPYEQPEQFKEKSDAVRTET